MRALKYVSLVFSLAHVHVGLSFCADIYEKDAAREKYGDAVASPGSVLAIFDGDGRRCRPCLLEVDIQLLLHTLLGHLNDLISILFFPRGLVDLVIDLRDFFACPLKCTWRMPSHHSNQHAASPSPPPAPSSWSSKEEHVVWSAFEAIDRLLHGRRRERRQRPSRRPAVGVIRRVARRAPLISLRRITCGSCRIGL